MDVIRPPLSQSEKVVENNGGSLIVPQWEKPHGRSRRGGKTAAKRGAVYVKSRRGLHILCIAHYAGALRSCQKRLGFGVPLRGRKHSICPCQRRWVGWCARSQHPPQPSKTQHGGYPGARHNPQATHTMTPRISGELPRLKEWAVLFVFQTCGVVVLECHWESSGLVVRCWVFTCQPQTKKVGKAEGKKLGVDAFFSSRFTSLPTEPASSGGEPRASTGCSEGL